MSTLQLQEWLREKLGEETSMASGEVDLDADFTTFNLDSLSVVSLSYELEIFAGTVIDPTVFSEFRTPNELVQWIQLQVK